tara:strand:- start:43 stop:285 length:243 start_codon:yes stop_codon:yes gene_type:complete
LTPSAKIKAEHGQCDYHIISNVQHNDYYDEDDDKTYNKIVIAIQNGELEDVFNFTRDSDDTIITDEDPIYHFIKADTILN